MMAANSGRNMQLMCWTVKLCFDRKKCIFHLLQNGVAQIKKTVSVNSL
jgi:hypothetical protein